MFEKQKSHYADKARAYQKSAIGKLPGNALRHHGKLRHTAHTRQNIDRRKNDTQHGKLINALVLVDVDETHGGIHQKIDLIEKK